MLGASCIGGFIFTLRYHLLPLRSPETLRRRLFYAARAPFLCA